MTRPESTLLDRITAHRAPIFRSKDNDCDVSIYSLIQSCRTTRSRHIPTFSFKLATCSLLCFKFNPFKLYFDSRLRHGIFMLRSDHTILGSDHTVLHSGRTGHHYGQTMLQTSHAVLQSGHSMLQSSHNILKSGHTVLQFGHSMLQIGHSILESGRTMLH